MASHSFERVRVVGLNGTPRNVLQQQVYGAKLIHDLFKTQRIVGPYSKVILLVQTFLGAMAGQVISLNENWTLTPT